MQYQSGFEICCKNAVSTTLLVQVGGNTLYCDGPTCKMVYVVVDGRIRDYILRWYICLSTVYSLPTGGLIDAHMLLTGGSDRSNCILNERYSLLMGDDLFRSSIHLSQVERDISLTGGSDRSNCILNERYRALMGDDFFRSSIHPLRWSVIYPLAKSCW